MERYQTLQSKHKISNDKYLKLYKLDSDLVDYNQNYLENSFNYSRSANDYFLSVECVNL